MASLADKVVVITGASSGIGAALAEVVAARGGKPVLVARREASLREVAGRARDAQVVVADVTRRADVERARDEAIARHGHIDVWVNNAGRGISRAVADLSDEDLDDMMLVNVKSALYGIQAVLPHLCARGAGQIMNVSSMLGRIPFPSLRSAYSAAKAALGSLTTNLRVDLRAKHPGVAVTMVYPGVVATDFGLNARHGGPDNRALPFAQPVDEVAAIMADAIERPRAEVYTRPMFREQLASYYTAEDVAEIESRPPFAPTAMKLV